MHTPFDQLLNLQKVCEKASLISNYTIIDEAGSEENGFSPGQT